MFVFQKKFLFLINEESINKLWEKKEIFIQHCLESKAFPKHVEMINFILKTLREKADFFCHKYFVMVNSYRFEITLLYRLTRIFDSFSLFLPQNYTDKNTAVWFKIIC